MSDELFKQFKNLFVELIPLLHNKVPASLMRDMETFIMEPYMNATCKTNSVLAYRIGFEISRSRAEDYVLFKSLHALFLARDEMLKGCKPSTIEALLNQSRQLLDANKACRVLEMNYG